MQVIKCPNDDEYFDLHTLADYPYGSSLIVTSNSAHIGQVVQSSDKPANSERGRPLHPKETILLHRSTDKYWIKSGPGFYVVQAITETITPFGVVDLSSDMYTGDAEGFRRIRVDSGQTGFFQGQEFRTFYEFSIASGASAYIKFDTPCDTILWEESITVDSGGVRLTSLLGATETAPFNTPLPIRPKNNMAQRRQPYYTARATVSADGIVTGGSIGQIYRIVTTGSTAMQSSIGQAAASERGIPAGTYYIRLQNLSNGTTTGVYNLTWEERPSDAFPDAVIN